MKTRIFTEDEINSIKEVRFRIFTEEQEKSLKEGTADEKVIYNAERSLKRFNQNKKNRKNEMDRYMNSTPSRKEIHQVYSSKKELDSIRRDIITIIKTLQMKNIITNDDLELASNILVAENVDSLCNTCISSEKCEITEGKKIIKLDLPKLEGNILGDKVYECKEYKQQSKSTEQPKDNS